MYAFELIVAWSFVPCYDPQSYAGGSLSSCRATQSRQIEGQGTVAVHNEGWGTLGVVKPTPLGEYTPKSNPDPPGRGFVVWLTTYTG
jgi:hypothetical protein